jgi:hydrogenase expression/formation protein HypE
MPESSTKLSIQLNCPVPELDFDVITLGHGSGGKLTNRLLDESVFKLFKNELLDSRHDGAIFNLNGKTAFTTDSFVVSPIFFPGGNIGELAVNGTINDLAMCGAIPKYISLGLILEEGLPLAELWEVLLGVKTAAEKAGVLIATGDTKVVERGKGDKLFVNTTGVGDLHPDANISIERIQEGDLILVSGPIANHGIAIMSVREGLEFESDVVSDTRPLNTMVKSMLDSFGPDIKLLRDPTRGGIATVLNEITGQIQTGIDIFETELPIDNTVSAACEMLGLDPLYVANEGIFVAVVNSSRADEIASLLRNFEAGRSTSIIGQITTEHPSKVILKSAIGGRRVVNMLPGDQLPRIC